MFALISPKTILFVEEELFIENIKKYIKMSAMFNTFDNIDLKARKKQNSSIEENFYTNSNKKANL